MRRSSLFAVGRSSFLVLVTASAGAFAVQACGDDDVVTAPPADAGADTKAPDPGKPDTGSNTNSDTGAPAADAKADVTTTPDASDAAAPVADADAGPMGDASPAKDATPDATPTPDASPDATAEAGPIDAGPPLLGTGPLMVAYSGKDLGVDVRPLASSKFAGNQLTDWSAAAPFTEVFSKGTNTVVMPGNDTIAAWGRWSGGTATVGAQNFAWMPNGGVVYVIGQKMGTVPGNQIVTATQVGSTEAVLSDGSQFPGGLGGSVGINYFNGVVKVGVNLTVVAGFDTVPCMSNGGSTTPGLSELVADATGVFGHGYNLGPGPDASAGVCGGPGNCICQVSGFVSGPNADRIAIVVHVFKGAGGTGKTLAGALVYKKP